MNEIKEDLKRAMQLNEAMKSDLETYSTKKGAKRKGNSLENLSDSDLAKYLKAYKALLEKANVVTIRVNGLPVEVRTYVSDGIEYVGIWQERIMALEAEMRKRNPEIFKSDSKKTQEYMNEEE